MPTTLTTTPMWTPALTPAVADLLNPTTNAVINVAHARRAELAWFDALLRQAQAPEDPLCWTEHGPTGYVMAIGATDYSVYSPSLIDAPTPTTLPGSPTLYVPVVAAASPTLSIVCDDGNTYRTDSAAALQSAVAFAGITAVADIVYCSGTGLFVACGSGASDAHVETTTDGVTWTSRSTDTTAPFYPIGRYMSDGGHVALATDGTAVLALQWEAGTACKQGYSEDGTTWTWTATTTPGSQQISHPAYDPVRDRWLAVGNEYAADVIVYNDDPSASATWTTLCAKPGAVDYGPILVTESGVYLYGNSYSVDGGASWRSLAPLYAQYLVAGRLQSIDANPHDFFSGLISQGPLAR